MLFYIQIYIGTLHCSIENIEVDLYRSTSTIESKLANSIAKCQTSIFWTLNQV